MADSGTNATQFSVMFAAHYNAVSRYARRRTDAQTADDVSAEVFLIAWRRFAELPAEPLPWLIGTARRVLANSRRGENRQVALRLRMRTERPVDSRSTAEDLETTERWRRALDALAPQDQEVLALLAWDGLSPKEAAESLGCGRSAFAMRLSRARRRLRSALDAAEATPNNIDRPRNAPERMPR